MTNPFKPRQKVLVPRLRVKQKTWCQKYGPPAWCKKLRIWIYHCLCRRIEKCLNIRLFKPPSENRVEYEAAGINLNKPRSTKIVALVTQNMPWLTYPVKKEPSLAQLKQEIIKALPRDLDQTSIDSKALADLAKDPEFLKGVNTKELQAQWKKPGSKTQLIKKLMDDYTRGVSMTGLVEKTKRDRQRLKKANLDIDKLNKKDADRLKSANIDLDNLTKLQRVYLLYDYARQPEKKSLWSKSKRLSRRYIYSNGMQYLDKPKRESLNKVISDYISGKYSRDGLPINAKLTTSQFEKLLGDYEKEKQNKFPFTSVTKIKWFAPK